MPQIEGEYIITNNVDWSKLLFDGDFSRVRLYFFFFWFSRTTAKPSDGLLIRFVYRAIMLCIFQHWGFGGQLRVQALPNIESKIAENKRWIEQEESVSHFETKARSPTRSLCSFFVHFILHEMAWTMFDNDCGPSLFVCVFVMACLVVCLVRLNEELMWTERAAGSETSGGGAWLPLCWWHQLDSWTTIWWMVVDQMNMRESSLLTRAGNFPVNFMCVVWARLGLARFRNCSPQPKHVCH